MVASITDDTSHGSYTGGSDSWYGNWTTHQLLVLQEMHWEMTSSQIIIEDGQQMMY